MGEFDNIIRTTEELAEKRGRELGLAEGQADTIRKMLAGGIPAEAIAAALGITTEECESYR